MKPVYFVTFALSIDRKIATNMIYTDFSVKTIEGFANVNWKS